MRAIVLSIAVSLLAFPAAAMDWYTPEGQSGFSVVGLGILFLIVWACLPDSVKNKFTGKKGGGGGSHHS